MSRIIKSLALAGVVLVVAAPAFAAPTNLTMGGVNFNPLGLDLDPFHLFTPRHHHRFHHHRVAMRHNHRVAMRHKMMKHMAMKQ